MKTKWLIVSWATILVFVLAYGQFQRRIDEGVAFSYGHRSHIGVLTRELLDQRSSSFLVGPHPGLNAKLDELNIQAAADYYAYAYSGDAPPPIGDGQATQYFFIVRSSDSQRLLGIRLRYQPSTKTYHVLSFWTPTNAQPSATTNGGGCHDGSSGAFAASSVAEIGVARPTNEVHHLYRRNMSLVELPGQPLKGDDRLDLLEMHDAEVVAHYEYQPDQLAQISPTSRAIDSTT